MKALQPDRQQRTTGSLCIACVYHPLNHDSTLYEGIGIDATADDGCALDFAPGSEQCKAMRTINCSVRKTK